MIKWIVSILLLNIPWIKCQRTAINLEPALLVVSYDGLAHQYFDRNVTHNYEKFARDGVWAEYMTSVFPTKSVTIHFSMATGLYAESHGATASLLYDSNQKTTISYGYDLFHYSNDTVPIWIANQKAGGFSGSMMWPGGEFEYNGLQCTFTEIYKQDKDFNYRVDKALSWFKDEKTPANLVMIYYEEPDKTAHNFGTESQEVTDMVSRVNNVVKYVDEQLIKLELDKRVNVIHLSDHGMADVPLANLINLQQYAAIWSCRIFGFAQGVQVVPKTGYENEVLTNLTRGATENGHFKVYSFENLPPRWHMSLAVRVAPIFVLADVGYAFLNSWYGGGEHQSDDIPFDHRMIHAGTLKSRTKIFGNHGYDNEDPSMRAVFMAKGPLISKGKTLKPVEVINLYNLFCSILKIDCPPNNGSTDPNIWNDFFVDGKGTTDTTKAKGNGIYEVKSGTHFGITIIGLVSAMKVVRWVVNVADLS